MTMPATSKLVNKASPSEWALEDSSADSWLQSASYQRKENSAGGKAAVSAAENDIKVTTATGNAEMSSPSVVRKKITAL